MGHPVGYMVSRYEPPEKSKAQHGGGEGVGAELGLLLGHLCWNEGELRVYNFLVMTST